MKRSAFGTGTELDVLLIEAFRAYRQGLLRQAQPRLVMPARDFDALRFLGTVGWVPLAARLHLRKLHAASGKGLTAAREGRLDDAQAHYERAQAHLRLLRDETRLAWLLGESTYQAGAAYLDFRRGRAEQARKRLDRAMDADLELEQAGLPVMQLHRIQQGHNLARMDLRQGRRGAAVELAGILLAFMEGQIDDLPYHHDWQPRHLQAIPRSLMRSMVHQIVGETACFIVAGDTTKEEWQRMIRPSRLCPDPEISLFPQVQYGLRAQAARLAADPEGYLQNLEIFFRHGIRQCHLLWYAFTVELVELCREVGTAHSHRVEEIILRDSARWKGLPAVLHHRFAAHPIVA